MRPTMSNIVQIIPAPTNLQAVFLDPTENIEEAQPVAAIALVAVDDGLGGIERDVLALVATDEGLVFTESYSNFDRLKWSQQKTS